MQSTRRRINLLGVMMMLNFLVYFLVMMSRNSGQGKITGGHPHTPFVRFWKKLQISGAFWNREQLRLDHIHNPLFLAAGNHSHSELQTLPDWLNSTCPSDPCEPNVRVATLIKDYNSLPQNFKDFLLHMWCRSYPMVTDAPGICSTPPFLLLAVKSLAPHFDRRQAIRQSWGRAGILDGHRIATVFLLGDATATDHFPDLSEMVRHEAELHGDILQWNYRDSFFNLTLKEVLFLDWLAANCSSARFVFKGDDDVFVNTRHVLHFLDNLQGAAVQDLFVGDVIANAGPHRDKKLKYYVPESVYQGKYPPYAGGGGFLYSGSVGLRLRDVSRHVVLYPIDDVYTGMCLQRLGLLPEKHVAFKTFDIAAKQRESVCAHRALMLVHPRTPQQMIRIWAWLSDPNLSCP